MIFGVTGQDGSYLSEELLGNDYRVIGVARRCSHNNMERISHISNPDFTVVEGDVTDVARITQLLQKYNPDHVYNLAAQSHVGSSFDQAGYTFQVTAGGALNILEAIRQSALGMRFYQASSSEIFGDQVGPDYDQNEMTRMNPQSPYAIAKYAAYQMTRLYRKSYGMFASNGILFNHESKRRGEQFVTRKITKWIGQYKAWATKYAGFFESGQYAFHQDWDNNFYSSLCDRVGFPKLRLGNLDAHRDWGHAADYVRAMRMIMEAGQPDDYVVATGDTYTIKQFLSEAFLEAGLGDWEKYVVIDGELYRPSDVPFLKGDSSKIRRELGWRPNISFQSLIREMVQGDICVTSER